MGKRGSTGDMDLFDYQARQDAEPARPLADRMRPETLAEFVGQRRAVAPGGLIRTAVENDRLFSMILWGPPGCGKTTLARIVAAETRSHFVSFSAVLSGVAQIRSVIEEAGHQRRFHRRSTLLFVDEIHRFNKAQQDAFLHHVESGLITLIGATTENPSFEVIPALMSRCRVITLAPLTVEDLEAILRRAVTDRERGLGDRCLDPEPAALRHLAEIADGDARFALNSLEAVATGIAAAGHGKKERERSLLTLDMVEAALSRKAHRYDKNGESHYNLISAFHKSLRGGDPDAALYWLARMLKAGEDPFYVLRRMVRFASEDVGNAAPQALTLCLGAMEAYRFLGSPEGELAIFQAAVYLATAPKSNRVYVAQGRVREAVDRTGALEVPLHIRNAPTGLTRQLGYGKGYKYAHDYEGAFVEQSYLPADLEGSLFYEPSERGFEKTIAERLARWRRLKHDHKNDNRGPAKES